VPLQPQKKEVDVPALIEEFDRKLERLKILYEQYFIGIEKREPIVPLKDVVRVMHVLDQEQIKNTGHRYRFRMLVQKLNSYKTYWSRTVRAIEAGTYFRDVARVQRSFARKGISVARTGRAASAADIERAFADAAKEAATREEGRPRHDTEEVAPVAGKKAAKRRDAPEEPELAPINLDAEPPTEYDEDEQTNPGIRPQRAPAEPAAAPPATTPRPAVRKTVAELPQVPDDLPAAPKLDLPELPAAPAAAAAAAKRPAAQARPRPAAPAAAAGAPSEAELQSLYRRFVKAKEMCGEDTSTVRYETLVKSIRSQLPKIAAEHGGRPVEFQVVIRNNRAILRAKPKE
jgi:hypothetical protein